jgi:hypothetical protein
VTLTLIPSEIAAVIAGSPAGVAGILMNRFGRSTSDLERHPPVLAGGPVVHRAEHVAGPADVAGGDSAGRLLHRDAARLEVGDLPVVGIAVLHGLGEDRRVGGDPDDVVVVDERLQVAGAQPVAADVVEPHRHSGLG